MKLEDVTLPYDYELEKSALSMLCYEYDKINLFDDKCFYVENCKKVFNSMINTKSTDFTVLAIDSWLDHDMVLELTTSFISNKSYDYISNELIKYKNARRILKGIWILETQARSLNIEKARDTLKKIEQVIELIQDEKTIQEIWIDYFEDIDKEKKIFNTGYKQLDSVLGLNWWQLIVLAGRPSMWKTTVMQNIAIRQSKNRNVWFISIEMKIFELIDRFICMLWWLSSYDMKNKKDIRDSIMVNLWDLMEKKLFLAENIYTLPKIEQFIIKNKLDICHIDYLWLIQYWDSKMPTITKISEITRQLKQIAKVTNCNIMLWCQLSRDVEKRWDKRPILADLRDSWSIEQDADAVIMLYRDDYYDSWSEKKNRIELIIRKQRNWELKTFETDCKFGLYRILDNWTLLNNF